AAQGPFSFSNIYLRSAEARLGSRHIMFYDPRPVAFGGFDALVLGTHLLFVTNHALLLAFRVRRRPVLYWGHGVERSDSALKARLARLATNYLAYTEGGASWLAAHGYPRDRIHVVRNTIDMEAQVASYNSAADQSEGDLRAEF